MAESYILCETLCPNLSKEIDFMKSFCASVLLGAQAQNYVKMDYKQCNGTAQATFVYLIISDS